MEKQMSSPIGKTVSEGAAKRARNTAYRAAREKHAAARAIAKQIIHLRTVQGLTQQELARRAKTSYSQVSRIESGRHQINHKTFKKIYTALGAQPLMGYELPATKDRPVHRELIAV